MKGITIAKLVGIGRFQVVKIRAFMPKTEEICNKGKDLYPPRLLTILFGSDTMIVIISTLIAAVHQSERGLALLLQNREIVLDHVGYFIDSFSVLGRWARRSSKETAVIHQINTI